MAYRAPVRDLAFALAEAAGAGAARAPTCRGWTPGTVEAVLQAAADLAEGVLAPINRAGDIEGSRLENGPGGDARRVRRGLQGPSPRAAGTACPPTRPSADRALPKALELAVVRDGSTGPTWPSPLCPTLTLAAIEAIHRHGTARQKSL